MIETSGFERDVFISYASEDRDAVARPLAELLSGLGVSVWFDQFDLKLGDSLRRKIDAGLTACRYGVVILSPSFFRKHYPNHELDGLAQREVEGNKVILPVWLNVDEQQVCRYSPPLADRIAARFEDGIYTVAMRILEVVRPDILEKIQQEAQQHLLLSRIRSGGELGSIIAGTHFSYTHHDELQDEAEVETVAGFLQEVHDGVRFGVTWSQVIMFVRSFGSPR